jgi:uncharacterized protein (DUF433 family)
MCAYFSCDSCTGNASRIIVIEAAMNSEYIEQRDGGYYVAGTRISLDSVVYSFNEGNSPERILEQFPFLDKPGNVYGAIAFYLDNKTAIDKYLEDAKHEFEAAGIPMSEANPVLWEKVLRARASMGGSRV